MLNNARVGQQEEKEHTLTAPTSNASLYSYGHVSVFYIRSKDDGSHLVWTARNRRTSGRGNSTYGRIVDAHGSYNRTREAAPLCVAHLSIRYAWFLLLSTPVWRSVQPFCTVHRCAKHTACWHRSQAVRRLYMTHKPPAGRLP